MRFDASALANVRFAISPSVELHHSIGVLDDPAARALHLPWATAAAAATADLDLGVLRALRFTPGYTPDFVHPPPSGPRAELEDELARMIAVEPEEVRREIRYAHRRGATMDPALQPFLDDPEAAVAELAELMRTYWARTMHARWPRIRALLEGDVLHRARRMADGGAAALFADVDPTVGWADDVLRIDKPHLDFTMDLADRGLLFVPSVFTWPRVRVVTSEPWQPTIIYPARGIGTLWERERPPAPDALAALIGRARAAVLAALDRPRTTTELARALDLTAGGVSQHLRVLRDAGLVQGHRVGRNVLYVRSDAGEALLG